MYNQTKLDINGLKIHIRKGVIQGGILSPKLFNIFYDTLLDKLEKLEVFILAYADDIVIAIIGKIKIT